MPVMPFSVACPAAHGPAPIVVVAPMWKPGQAVSVAPAVEAFVHAGLAVVIVNAPGQGDDEDYTERLTRVVAEVGEHGVQGCATTHDVALWGVERGGRAALAVHDPHVKAIVALFVAWSCKDRTYELCDGPADEPTLLLDGEGQSPVPNATSIVVRGARECDLHVVADQCWGWIAMQHVPEKLEVKYRERAIDRQRYLLDRSTAWLGGHLGGSQDVAAWPHWQGLDVGELAEVKHRPDPRTSRTLFSLPLELGGTIGHDSVRTWGIRPELIHAFVRNHDPESIGPGWGVGVYGELAAYNGAFTHDGHAVLGAGITGVRYGSWLGIAPSLGVYKRGDETGVEASLFGGLRGYIDTGPLDTPTGLRIDARFGLAGATDRTVVASLVVDLPGAIQGLRVAAGMATGIAMGGHD